MKAKTIKAFTTVLEHMDTPPPEIDFETPPIAIQARFGAMEDLLVHFPPENSQQDKAVIDATEKEMSGESS